MNDVIKIRTATIEDLSSLLRFEQEIVTAERPFDPTLRPGVINYYDLAELVRSERAEVVVAEINGRLVASGSAIIKKAKPYLDHALYAYLGFMYTDPDFRGRGLNKRIIQELQQWAAKEGLTEIRLTVYEENAGAIRAYEKTGFKKHLVEMRLRF